MSCCCKICLKTNNYVVIDVHSKRFVVIIKNIIKTSQLFSDSRLFLMCVLI